MQTPLSSLTHRERAGLAVAVGVLALFVLGSTLYRSRAAPLQPTVFPRINATASPPPTPSPHPSPAPRPARVLVYVSGAVQHPGVYTLTSGQRLYQAIQKAGGFKRGAQQDALNLAGYLQDADQIHVPTQNASASPTSVPPRPPRGSTPAAATASSDKLHSPSDGKISLNHATQEELQKLPGVGPSTAQSILDYRKANQGFRELEELKEVRGIGEKKFAKMQPFLTL